MKKLIPMSWFSGAVAVTVMLASGNAPQNSYAQTPAVPADGSVASVAPPPDIAPTSPLAQVIRLTQAGVDQGIILAYVTNSTATFNLDSDRIIYLSNLGVPNDVVTAMIQRDQQLQQQFQGPQPAPQPPAPANPVEVPAQPGTQPAPVTVDYFTGALSPYGSWVEVSGYGRCWRPTVVVYDSSWQPYCDRGHWVYTDCGWYWDSDYAWGATFHYGRWFRDTRVGWCWSPDTVWAPSWVTWRYSEDYCGWAPLPPRTVYQSGVGILYQGGRVAVDFNFGLAANCFTFVPTRHFCDSQPRNYRAAPAQVTQIYNRTKIINNIKVTGNGNNRVIVNNGIAVQNIAAASKTTIRPVPVHEINRSFNHARTVSGADQPALRNNSLSPARPSVTPQEHFSQPAANQNSQPQFTHARTPTTYHDTGAVVPQNPAPAHNAILPAPAAHYNQPPQTETPRNYGRNSETHQNTAAPSPEQTPPPHNFNQPRNQPRQNNSQSSAAATPQPNAPESSSQTDNGGGRDSGGHNKNQNWH